MKINSVYKQASIERNSIRKKAQQDGTKISDITQFKKENITVEQLLMFDALVIQQQRIGRLRSNTSFHTNCLNNFLTENAPSNRVLSGEVIIF
jgi:hypothetical protein